MPRSVKIDETGITIRPDPAVMVPGAARAGRITTGEDFHLLGLKYQVTDAKKRVRYRGNNMVKAVQHVNSVRAETGLAYLHVQSDDILGEFPRGELTRLSRKLYSIKASPLRRVYPTVLSQERSTFWRRLVEFFGRRF